MSRRKRSNTRKRKRKSRKRQRGGFFKQMTNKIVMLWQNPHKSSTPMDCCPCVFSLLGMPPKTVRYLREKNLHGFSKEKIESGFNEGYPDFIFKFQKSDNIISVGPDMFKAYLFSIWETIPVNFATVGGYERQDKTKHCIVLAKNNDGQPIILDAQANKGYHGINNIATYLLTQNVKFVYHLVSQKKGNSTKQPLILNKEGHKIMSQNEDRSVAQYLHSQLAGISLEERESKDGESKDGESNDEGPIPMDIDY